MRREWRHVQSTGRAREGVGGEADVRGDSEMSEESSCDCVSI
jgi:hypothetical protein